MDVKTIFGVVLTICGFALLLFSGYVMLRGGGSLFGTSISGWGGLIPFVIGTIFFGSGIKLFKTT